MDDFGKFLNGFAKIHDWSSWTLTECDLSWKIVKYRILSEVCMINSTVSPQMWCIKSIKGWFTHPQICWQEFVKQTCRTQKIRPDLFSKNLFSRPNLLWWRALNVIEDFCYFLGVLIFRQSTRCKKFHSKIMHQSNPPTPSPPAPGLTPRHWQLFCVGWQIPRGGDF